MRTALAIAAAVAGVAFVSTKVYAAPPRAVVDCYAFSSFAANMARFREVGAPLARVIEILVRDNPPGPLRDALVREARRVWAERASPGEAAYSAFKRCEAQLGDVGAES